MREKFEPKIGERKEREISELEDLEKKEPCLRERRREVLYEKIEEKVGIIKDIRGLSEEWANLDVEEIKKACQEKMKNIKSYFPGEVVDKDSKLELLKLKEEELTKQFGATEDKIALLENKKEKGEVIDEKELKGLEKKSDELMDQQYEISDVISLLKKDDDVLFLSRVKDFFDGLIEKRKQTIQAEEAYKKDPGGFLKNLLQLKSKRDKTEIEVRFSGYSVNLILPPEDFKSITRQPPTVYGGHIPETIFNIIKDHPNKEETIVHENNHNLSESFVKKRTSLDLLKKRLNNCVERLERLKGWRAPSVIIEKEENLIKKAIEEYIFKTFDEVIADIDRIAEGGITTFLSHFEEVTKRVYQFGQNLENKETKEIILGAYEKMQDRFVDFISELSTSFFVARKIDRIEDVKAAVILFKPEQMIRKLPKFTKHLAGEDNYEIYSGLEVSLTGGRFIRDIEASGAGLELLAAVFGEEIPQAKIDLAKKLKDKKSITHFFGLNNVKKLSRLLQKSEIKINITDEDLKNFTNWLIMTSASSVFRANKELLGLENFSQVNECLRNIAERLDFPQLSDFGEKELAHCFCSLQLKAAIKSNNFQELDAIYKKWKGSEVLTESFTRAIKSFSKTHKIEKKSLFWQWFKEKVLDKETRT